MNAQLSCASAEHYTPSVYVEAARSVLGAIDLDPASCAAANRTVQAARYYDKVDDGLAQPWHGRVFVNPPGDRRGKLVRAFWRRACEHALCGGRDAVVLWVGYSLEQLRLLQRCKAIRGGRCPTPLDWPIVILAERIDWVRGIADPLQLEFEQFAPGPGEGVESTQGSPTHGNYFCLLGGGRAERSRFRRTFGAFGAYLPGRRRRAKAPTALVA